MRRSATASLLPFVAAAFVMAAAVLVRADGTPQPLPFAHAWTNTTLISVSDDWSGVPGVQGFLGQGITGGTGVDPQTLLTTSTLAGDLDVSANQTNPNTFATGGVAEFDTLANPTIALNGSGTADAPYVLLALDTTGLSSIRVSYTLRDLDGSIDDAVMPVALQFRVGSTGPFTNVPAAFVADATTGPSLATLVTPVSVDLPAAADDQAERAGPHHHVERRRQRRVGRYRRHRAWRWTPGRPRFPSTTRA